MCLIDPALADSTLTIHAAGPMSAAHAAAAPATRGQPVYACVLGSNFAAHGATLMFQTLSARFTGHQGNTRCSMCCRHCRTKQVDNTAKLSYMHHCVHVPLCLELTAGYLVCSSFHASCACSQPGCKLRTSCRAPCAGQKRTARRLPVW